MTDFVPWPPTAATVLATVRDQISRSSTQPHTEKPEAHSDGDRCCDGHGVRYPIAFPNHAAILADCVAPEAMLVRFAPYSARLWQPFGLRRDCVEGLESKHHLDNKIGSDAVCDEPHNH